MSDAAGLQQIWFDRVFVWVGPAIAKVRKAAETTFARTAAWKPES